VACARTDAERALVIEQGPSALAPLISAPLRTSITPAGRK